VYIFIYTHIYVNIYIIHTCTHTPDSFKGIRLIHIFEEITLFPMPLIAEETMRLLVLA
jgi:hypothetical protein